MSSSLKQSNILSRVSSPKLTVLSQSQTMSSVHNKNLVNRKSATSAIKPTPVPVNKKSAIKSKEYFVKHETKIFENNRPQTAANKRQQREKMFSPSPKSS